MALKEGCPGSKEIRNPSPDDINCFWCDTPNEIWSDETEITCSNCGKTISRELGTTCLEWCPSAKECVGVEKYERLMKHKKK